MSSTALSARLDPEDYRAVIGAYHRFAAAVIERTGGFVAKYMGDGVAEVGRDWQVRSKAAICRPRDLEPPVLKTNLT